MKQIIFIVTLALILYSCNSTVDFKNSNKRSYEIIERENKNGLAEIITDTLLNFKTVAEIIKIFGKPETELTISYKYPAVSILWVLEGPLHNFKSYSPILMMEWHYREKQLLRNIFFIKKDGIWLSICNILYPDDLQY